MQTNDLVQPPSSLNGLDSALHRLGMLAAGPDSRQEYMQEMRKRPCLTIDTRYVSNVSIGFRFKPLGPYVRHKPYTIKERHRTRSENNDNDKDVNVAIVEDTMEIVEELSQLKKAKSLESIVAESGGSVTDLKGIVIGNCPELDVVSNCIQNLRVVE